MDEIVDYLEDGYQDYLNTIPDNIYQKQRNNIINKVLENSDKKIFDLVNKKLNIKSSEMISWLVNVHHKNSAYYGSKKVSLKTIQLLENEFPEEYLKYVNGKISNLEQIKIFLKCDIEILKYIYEDSTNKDIVIDISLSKAYLQSPKDFNSLETFEWFYNKFSKTITLKTDEKYETMYNYVQSSTSMFDEDTKIKLDGTSLKNFRKLQKILEIPDNELEKLMLYTRKSGYYGKSITFEMLWDNGGYNLIYWIIDMIGPSKLIKKDNIETIISKCVRRKNSELLKLLLNYMNILGLKFNPHDYTYNLKSIISEDWRNDFNEEIIWTLVELGVEPSKNTKYYNYYKNIKILN